MSTLVTILHVIVCLFLMLTVLLQNGKGGGMGGAFGGSNAGTVFGGGGASNFLKRLTAIAGTIFMVTSIVLAYLSSHNTADALEKYGEQQQALADEKAQAIDSAAQKGTNGSGSAVGSGSAGSAVGSGSAAIEPAQPSMGEPTGPNKTVEPSTVPAGTGATNTPSKPAENPTAPANGSAGTPAGEKPTPAPSGSTGIPAANGTKAPAATPPVTPPAVTPAATGSAGAATPAK